MMFSNYSLSELSGASKKIEQNIVPGSGIDLEYETDGNRLSVISVTLYRDESKKFLMTLEMNLKKFWWSKYQPNK